MTFDSFVKRFIGKAVDYDGVSGVQCVDLVKLYLYNVFGIRAGAWGNARDYWLDFNSHKIMKENCKDRKCRRFIKLYILTFIIFRPAEFHLKSKNI